MRILPKRTLLRLCVVGLPIGMGMALPCARLGAAESAATAPGILANLAEAVKEAVSNGAPQPAQTQPASGAALQAPAQQPVRGDLRTLIGVNPAGLKRVEMPNMPSMTVRGYIEPKTQPPMALLEITELNRIFLVHVGTEIPVMVHGRVAPLGRNELTGLGDQARPAGAAGNDDAGHQSQIILKVMKVTNEGVTVEAGLLSQTIIIR